MKNLYYISPSSNCMHDEEYVFYEFWASVILKALFEKSEKGFFDEKRKWLISEIVNVKVKYFFYGFSSGQIYHFTAL